MTGFSRRREEARRCCEECPGNDTCEHAKVCMCGDCMEGHAEPMWCGHSPVSMHDYYSSGSGMAGMLYVRPSAGGQMDDLRERAEEIADFAVGERHDDGMYQRVADMALTELRAAVEEERTRLNRIIDAYDAYRARGVMPAPDQYQAVVVAIEEARAAIRARQP